MEARSIAAAVLASSPLPPRGAVSRQGVEIARPAEMHALLGTRTAAASSAARAECCASNGAASSAIGGTSTRAVSSTTAGHRRALNRTDGAREARPVVSRKKRRGLRRVAHLSAGDGAQPSPESARAVWAEVLIVGLLHSTRGDEEGGESAQGVAGEASCSGSGAQQEGLGVRGDGLAGQGGVWTEADEAELIARAVGGAVGGAVVNAAGALIAGVVCAGAGDAEGAEAAWEKLGAEGSAGVSLAGEAEAEGEGGESEMARGRLELERAQLELAMRESRGEAERREAECGAAERWEAVEGEAERGEAEAVEGAVAAGEAELRETTGSGEGFEEWGGARNGEGSVCAGDTVGLLVARKGAAGAAERAERGVRADAAGYGESSDDEAAAVEARPAAYPAALNSLHPSNVFSFAVPGVWFVVLVLAGAVERITGIASGVAFERDWVILLAGQDNAAALANANAMLRRADLFCDVAGPLVFGWLLSAFSPAVCIRASLATMLLSLPILICLVLLTDRQSNGVLSRPKPPAAPLLSLEPPSTEPTSTSSCMDSRGVGRGSSEGATAAGAAGSAADSGASTRSPSPAAGFPSPALLLMSVARAVAAALTGSCRAAGSVLGMSFRAFRGACAAMGFAATFLSPLLITRLGLLQAGGAALLFQSLVLAASLGVFALSHSMGQPPLSAPRLPRAHRELSPSAITHTTSVTP
ncbi:unnamed protein product [Closterium sp. Naga37s-1]|nr:unnamed protein product [Closterium sp. Naga37s-1]